MMKIEIQLLKIAFPAMLESIFVVLVLMLDTWMVSPLGTTAISAVAVANHPKVFLFMAFLALGTASTITVSHAMGRNDRLQANAVMLSSVRKAALWSVIMAAIIIIFARPVMIVISNQPDTMDMSVIFLRIIMVGMIFQAMSVSLNASLRGIGRMKATLLSNITLGVVDVLFNYLLIQGHGGFPAMGVAGSALATTIGCIAGFIVSLFFLLDKDCFLNFLFCQKNYVRVEKEVALEMKRNIINVFNENILTRIGFILSGIIVAHLGSYETSVFSVGLQLMNFSFAFGDGIQVAVMVLVGQCVGSGTLDACMKYIRAGISTGLVVSVFVAAGCAFSGGLFFHSFNTEVNFVAMGRVVSCFIACIIPFQIVRIVRISVLRGLGDTRTPAIIGTICALALNPPLTLLFAVILGMGQTGLWSSVAITQIGWFVMAEVMSRKALAKFKKLQVASTVAPTNSLLETKKL